MHRNSENFSLKLVQNSTRITEKSRFLLKFQQKSEKSLTKICEDFELRAVQRCGNLVDLEKRCKMRPWTQKSALIQLRTSLLKFDDLAEKSEKSSVSNLSTKVQSIVLFYRLTDAEGTPTGENLLTPERLADLRSFELALLGLPGYSDYVSFY